MPTPIKANRDLSIPTPTGKPRQKALRSDSGVKRQTDLNHIRTYTGGRLPTGCVKDRHGRPLGRIHFPPYLFDQILAEAKSREISFNRLCIELMEAGLSPE